ncbi:DEAD/DEAH box helicase [Salimicrobium halophilum]|uniref:Superfamily II DNA or RNA helicase, SNF2 family n=1 Tax=Salimicrobium halophilum TaxID=86666 RepID=A0A1G8V4J9_9BACI|nr:DEAD/DEAH box helicase [Salimicrobium halophilum]SDJ60919.1 Superfamily II DNA or RNA helicase, SNF2 family [Salimicrobium halophilum]
MQANLLQPNKIKQRTGEAFFNRGKTYFERGKVYGLSYNEAIQSWRAVVTGTDDYEVRVFFFDEGDFDSTCECKAYETYYTCKHIAAVLLAIRDEWLDSLSPVIADRNTEKRATLSYAQHLTDAFRNETVLPEQKTSLLFHYYLHVSPRDISLEFKMGEYSPYVIKDIRTCVHHLKEGKQLPITKKFSYDPSVHTLTETDEQIIELLALISQEESFFGDQFSMPRERRYLPVPPAHAYQLLGLLDEQKTEVLEWKQAIGPLSYSELPSLSFEVNRNKGAFQLSFRELEKYRYLKDYQLLQDENTLYALKEDQLEVVRKWKQAIPFETSDPQYIPTSDMEAVVSHVLPTLEEAGDVHYSEEVTKAIIDEPLVSVISIDHQDWALTLDLKFHYGDHTVDPFRKQSSPGMIIKRDYTKEDTIMQLIEQADFKFDGAAIYLDDEDKIDVFVRSTLLRLQQIADVYLSSSMRNLLQTSPELKPTIDVNESTDWLDISFEIDGIGEEDIVQVMQAAMERKKYYRLTDGTLLSLQNDSFDRFRELTDELDVKSIDDATLSVSQMRSMQVDEVLEVNEEERKQRFQTLITHLKNPEVSEHELPSGLNADLRPYQLTGFRWMKTLATYSLGGILADDMGLGKTIQTIAFLLSEFEEKNDLPRSLIVAPASLVFNWKKEIETFAPGLSVEVISGTKQERDSKREKSDADIWVTSYPLLRRDEEAYEEDKFHAFILDEAQAIKNETTKVSKSTRQIKAKHKFALSGTPIENALTELWAIFQTIMPGFYQNKKEFLQLSHEQISRMTRPFILRRMKTEVLDDLPDKIESVQYSELTRNQKEVYLAYLERIQKDVQETIQTKGLKKGKIEILAGLTRLRQICCHPSLFLENYEGTSGKLDQLKELLDELKQNNHRVLLFSQFSSMLTMLHEELTALGYNCFYLDGSTKSEDRMKYVERFNSGEKDIFLISLKAGGTGLNLTGADTVILYDLWWNPAVEEQAAGRAHRIGQKRSVQVVRMISEGTIEERIYELQQKKRDLVDQIIQPGESMLQSLSEDDIKELFQLN